MNRLSVRIAFAAIAIALFAGTAVAQTYTRTETNATYSQRTGNGADVPLTDDSYDDGSRYVPLAWSFPFFDRTYRGCWMNTNGRIHFADTVVDDYDNDDLTTPVTEEDHLEAITVFGCDITGHTLATRDTQFRVFYESDRVVFQWTDVAMYESDEYGVRLNFQCHIFPSGEIRLHSGPTSIFLATAVDYSSGIVNFDGTASYPGFNNTLLLQTALPANGTMVTFTPSGFVQADGIVASGTSGFNYNDRVYFQGTTDAVVGAFRLQANGAGDTVTQIDIRHNQPGLGETLTLKLYADSGVLGVFDGDTLIQSQPMNTSTTSFTALTQVLDGTTPVRHYLLAVDVTTIDEDFNTYFYFDLDGGDITTLSQPVWGGYLMGDSDPEEPEYTFLEGPFVEFNVSSALGEGNALTAGGAEVAIASFEVALRHSNVGSVILNSFDGFLQLTTVAIGDIAQVALYRDGGTIGVLDGSDVQIATIANPVSSNLTFSGLAEAMTTGGRDYIVTVMVGGSYVTAAIGEINFQLLTGGENFTPSAAFWDVCEAYIGTTWRVMPNMAVLYLRKTEATAFDVVSGQLPVFQGATNVPVVHFTLQASSGAQTVTGVNLAGDGTQVSAARLYRDNGTTPGRFDAGDTLAGTATTLSATNVTFTALSEAIGTTPVRYIVVMDVAAAASAGSTAYDLPAANVTGSVPVLGSSGTVGGAFTAVSAASTGVNVTVNLVTSSASVSGSDMVLIATCQQQARNGGGTPTELRFEVLNVRGGIAPESLQLITYLEGTGPIGQLDASDFLMTFSDDDFGTGAVARWGDNDTIWVSTTLNFLVFIRVSPEACDFDGNFQVVFRGLQGGSFPALASLPNYRLIGGNLQIASSSGGGKGGGGDDSGCSTGTGSGANWLLLLGAMGVLFVGVRMRRSRA